MQREFHEGLRDKATGTETPRDPLEESREAALPSIDKVEVAKRKAKKTKQKLFSKRRASDTSTEL